MEYHGKGNYFLSRFLDAVQEACQEREAEPENQADPLPDTLAVEAEEVYEAIAAQVPTTPRNPSPNLNSHPRTAILTA